MCVQSWSSLRFLLESDPGQPKIKPATFEHPISSSYKLRCVNTSVREPTRDPVRSSSDTSPARSQLPSPMCPALAGDTHPPGSRRELPGTRASLLFGGRSTCHHAWEASPRPPDLTARGPCEYFTSESCPVSLCLPGAEPSKLFPDLLQKFPPPE